ncbi:MAG: nitrogen fixation protein [Rhodocyclaceae bacterium]
MKIAVTDQNFRTVTGHRGKSRRFLVFDAQPDSVPTEIDRLDLPSALAFHEFPGGPHPVDGVDALNTGSAGTGFIRKLAERRIRVVVTGETDPIKAVVDVVAGRITPPQPDDRGHHHSH